MIAFAPAFDRFGDRHRHAAVLERAGRVEPFELGVDAARSCATSRGRFLQLDQRRVPSLSEITGVSRVDRQAVAVVFDESR